MPFVFVASVATIVDYGLLVWFRLIGGGQYWKPTLLGIPGAILSSVVMMRIAALVWGYDF